MSSPFVAEIRIFGFNFPPTGWAQCNGQLLPISQNTALFSLLGTMYGGDGKSTFALPDLQGNVPIHRGQGPGLSIYSMGEMAGTETVTLLNSEIPAHSHLVRGNTVNGNTATPSNTTVYGRGNWSFQGNSGGVATYTTAAPDTAMSPQAVSIAGGGLPHNNLMPYLVLNFCIAMQGVFPPQG